MNIINAEIFSFYLYLLIAGELETASNTCIYFYCIYDLRR